MTRIVCLNQGLLSSDGNDNDTSDKYTGQGKLHCEPIWRLLSTIMGMQTHRPTY